MASLNNLLVPWWRAVNDRYPPGIADSAGPRKALSSPPSQIGLAMGEWSHFVGLWPYRTFALFSLPSTASLTTTRPNSCSCLPRFPKSCGAAACRSPCGNSEIIRKYLQPGFAACIAIMAMDLQWLIKGRSDNQKRGDDDGDWYETNVHGCRHDPGVTGHAWPCPGVHRGQWHHFTARRMQPFGVDRSLSVYLLYDFDNGWPSMLYGCTAVTLPANQTSVSYRCSVDKQAMGISGNFGVEIYSSNGDGCADRRAASHPGHLAAVQWHLSTTVTIAANATSTPYTIRVAPDVFRPPAGGYRWPLPARDGCPHRRPPPGRWCSQLRGQG